MALDVQQVRAQFPALALEHDGRPRIYFDNPAGTQVPEIVLTRMRDTMVHRLANTHGVFRTSVEATEVTHQAHVWMADLYNAASPDEIVFGPNMTSLTFMMTRVLAGRFQPGDEIITTHMEHDANNTPWRRMAEERGLVVKTLPWNRDTYEFDLDELDRLITPRTRFASLNYSSNILGTINPVKAMVARLRAVGALTYVDAVQYAPHGPIDVQDLGCDFLVSSTYKYYGPHQGVLYGRLGLLQELPSWRLRVVEDESPGKFETGTQSLEGQAGSMAAVEYLHWVGSTMGREFVPTDPTLRPRTGIVHAGLRAMVEYEHRLSARLVEGLGTIPGVVVRGITDPTRLVHRVPTVSITCEGVDPADLAVFLDQHGVYAWSGHNYALPVIEFLGLEQAGGVLRLGPTHYNTLDECDTVVQLIADYMDRV